MPKPFREGKVSFPLTTLFRFDLRKYRRILIIPWFQDLFHTPDLLIEVVFVRQPVTISPDITGTPITHDSHEDIV